MARAQILIVEDEPGIADTLSYALRTEGFEPLWCATGEAALQHLPPQAPAPALVILDVGLPDLNGFALCAQLRAQRLLPVIFLTARDAESERVLGFELGADDYVPKPFSPRELAARVRVVLRRNDGMAAGALAPGGFAHDSAGMRVRYHGQLLDLTRYEYGLLALLLSRPGAVFSRAQLMDRVWGDAFDSNDRTVDTHIKTLRAKLRAISPSVDPIRTHRGLGYALDVD